MFKRPPYKVQIEALKRGADMDHFGYWLEQGLGKTTVDLANVMHDLYNGKIDAHIVVTPSYLLSGWEAEAKEIGFPLTVTTWPQQIMNYGKGGNYVYIMNQEAILQSGGRYLDELFDTKMNISMSIDDAAVKKFSGVTSKRIRELGQRAVKTRDLCGTPMSQNVMDVYPRLRFLRKLNGVNPYQFRNRFAVMGGYMGKQVKGIQNEAELNELLSGVVFRALKQDWWDDMPEKIYLPPREVEMVKNQVIAYKSMLQEFVVYVSKREDDAVFAAQVMHMKQKLQQISRGFVMDSDNDRVVELVQPSKNPAIKATKNIIENTPGKIIVATHYTYSTNVLAQELRDYGVVVLRGGMSKDEIAAAKEAFNNDPAIRVLVGIDRVTARGHTLLGSKGNDRCSTTLFYENSYDLEVRSQLEDRNHRFGQDRAVTYIDLFCSREDRVVVTALQKKQDLVNAIINAVKSVRVT